MRILNRITVADVMRNAKEQKLDADGAPVLKDGKPVLQGVDMNRNQDLFVLFGTASESKDGKPTQFGTYKEYFGAFEAKRLCDGELFSGGRTIFPPPTDSVMENMFNAMKAEDSSAKLDFAFVIGTEAKSRIETVDGEPKIVNYFRFSCRPVPMPGVIAHDPLANIKNALANSEIAGLLGLSPSAPAITDQSGGDDAKGSKASKAKETA